MYSDVPMSELDSNGRATEAEWDMENSRSSGGIRVSKRTVVLLVAFLVILVLIAAALIGGAFVVGRASVEGSTTTTVTKEPTRTATKTATTATTATTEEPISAHTSELYEPPTPHTPPAHHEKPHVTKVRDYQLEDDEEAFASIMEWKELLINAPHARHSISDDKQSLDWEYFADCVRDERDWLRMFADPLCTRLWLQLIQHENVTWISNLLPVVTKEEQDQGEMPEQARGHPNGGMITHLSNGYRAYWKPCYGNTGEKSGMHGSVETYYAEIIAFHLDRLLGFFRTPAVAPRHFTFDQLRGWAQDSQNRPFGDPNAVWAMETGLKHCNDSDGMEGAIVGWSPHPILVLTHEHKKYANTVMLGRLNRSDTETVRAESFDISEHSSAAKIKMPMESMMVYMFGVASGLVDRFKHNEITLCNATYPAPYCGEASDRLKWGPLTYMDNDRAQWNYTARGIDHEWRDDWTFRAFCKFPYGVSKRILAMHKRGITFSSLLAETLASYEPLRHGPFWSEEQSAILDEAIEQLRVPIQECIDEHGEENVLIPVPWQKPQKSYKNMRRMWEKRRASPLTCLSLSGAYFNKRNPVSSHDTSATHEFRAVLEKKLWSQMPAAFDKLSATLTEFERRGYNPGLLTFNAESAIIESFRRTKYNTGQVYSSKNSFWIDSITQGARHGMSEAVLHLAGSHSIRTPDHSITSFQDAITHEFCGVETHDSWAISDTAQSVSTWSDVVELFPSEAQRVSVESSKTLSAAEAKMWRATAIGRACGEEGVRFDWTVEVTLDRHDEPHDVQFIMRVFAGRNGQGDHDEAAVVNARRVFARLAASDWAFRSGTSVPKQGDWPWCEDPFPVDN